MKVLVGFLFIFYLNEAVSQYAGPKHPHYKSNVLPRKNLQILISRKFLNGRPPPSPTKKQSLQHDKYTVFPAVASMEKKLYHVPSSPYFPNDHMDSQKRVKKALEDYAFTGMRKKRSADDTEAKAKAGKRKEDIAAQRKERKGDNTRHAIKKSKKDKHTTIQQQPNEKAKQKEKTMNLKDDVRGTRVKKVTKHRSEVHVLSETTVKTNEQQKSANSHHSNSQKRPHKKHSLRKRKVAKKGETTKNGHYLRDNSSRRLIAARDALIEDFPYVVSIQKNGEHWCAGALLNPVLIITTANCLWKSNRMSRLRVRVGSQHSDRGGQVVRIQEVMKHPRWSIRSSPDNDVALAIINKRLVFSDKLHGVDLPNRIMMPPFEDAWITSWGAERRDGVVDKKSVSLQMYHAHLIDRTNCNNVTQRFGVTVTENFICLTQVGRRAPCTRDTGAPAVSDGVLWGLASWGIRKLCGTERFPAMFSYLASQTNMDFIVNATRFLMSDERMPPFLDRYPTEAWVAREKTTPENVNMGFLRP